MTKANLEERYRTAVRTSDMRSDARSWRSDSDVIGAMGLADRRLTTGWVPTGPEEGHPIRRAPLAVALQRLFAGDNAVAHTIVEQLASMAFDQSWVLKVKMTRIEAQDMAKACIAWFRDGVCKVCGGHGYQAIHGTPALSERECKACNGAGKVAFDAQFHNNGKRPERAQLARWLVTEMEREAGRAGPAAMAAIAPRLHL